VYKLNHAVTITRGYIHTLKSKSITIGASMCVLGGSFLLFRIHRGIIKEKEKSSLATLNLLRPSNYLV